MGCYAKQFAYLLMGQPVQHSQLEHLAMSVRQRLYRIQQSRQVYTPICAMTLIRKGISIDQWQKILPALGTLKMLQTQVSHNRDHPAFQLGLVFQGADRGKNDDKGIMKNVFHNAFVFYIVSAYPQQLAGICRI